MITLQYYGGDGFGNCSSIGEFLISYDNPENDGVFEKHFNDFTRAKNFYDSLNVGKAFWNGAELCDCRYLAEEEIDSELGF